jgi:hypothetical protein
MQKGGPTYCELGGDFLDRLRPDRLARRLEELGHTVALRPKVGAA